MACTRFCGRPSCTRQTGGLDSSVRVAAARASKGWLAKNIRNDLATYLRPALFPAQMHVAEGILIETHLMQEGSVKIAEVDRLLDGLEADGVCRAINRAAPEYAAGHPHAEPGVVVVATIALL